MNERKTRLVYHGSRAEDFETFDITKCKTAKHIYVTDSREGAEFFAYQGRVMAFEADLGRHMDITDPYERESAEVLKHIFNEIGREWGFEDLDAMVEAVLDGQLYQNFTGPRFQDAFLDEIFAMGYDSVTMPDQMGGGTIGASIVFNDPSRLRKIAEPAPAPETGFSVGI